ncbi:MAG: hypothetical protein IT378_17430 [Sandaracinaceae bacterium]|nr:hypothetical protein [Sandaracinaceae bacterium]
MSSTRLVAALLLLCACGAPPPAEEPSGDPPPDVQQAERPTMSVEQCQERGGEVVGDIGDGAIHRPDYRCPGGSEPMGSIPLGVEGSVCCPAQAGAQPPPLDSAGAEG